MCSPTLFWIFFGAVTAKAIADQIPQPKIPDLTIPTPLAQTPGAPEFGTQDERAAFLKRARLGTRRLQIPLKINQNTGLNIGGGSSTSGSSQTSVGGGLSIPGGTGK